VWITGLPASGKSTIAAEVKNLLAQRRVDVEVLESDVLRKVLSERPGYAEADREAFYRRMVWIGVMLSRHGVPVIFDATANKRSYRDHARRQIPCFVEIFVDVPLEVCRQRDPKGIYRNETDVPGLQAVYEPPESPDLVIDGVHEFPADAARRVVEILEAKRFLP
jgi:adenylylsulfate kinase